MKHRIAYDESIYAELEKEHEQNRIHRLERSAKSLGFTLPSEPNRPPSPHEQLPHQLPDGGHPTPRDSDCGRRLFMRSFLGGRYKSAPPGQAPLLARLAVWMMPLRFPSQIFPASMPSHHRLPIMNRILLLLLSLVLLHRSSAAGAEKPNIVFILIDDFGYADSGPYGAKDIRTPNMDRLAREGVKFTDFYANAPVCTPTRCGFITGRWQQRVGFEWAMGFSAEAFRRRG